MSLMPWNTMSMMSPFGYSDMFSPWSADPYNLWDVSRSLMQPMERSFRRMERNMEREAGRLLSSVKEDDKTFQMMVDVGQFRPDEVSVKTTDKNVIIHGRHEERTDRHGYVSRE